MPQPGTTPEDRPDPRAAALPAAVPQLRRPPDAGRDVRGRRRRRPTTRRCAGSSSGRPEPAPGPFSRRGSSAVSPECIAPSARSRWTDRETSRSATPGPAPRRRTTLRSTTGGGSRRTRRARCRRASTLIRTRRPRRPGTSAGATTPRMAVDPVDDCTFWFTTEYGGSGNGDQGRRLQVRRLRVPRACRRRRRRRLRSRRTTGSTVSWNDSATAVDRRVPGLPLDERRRALHPDRRPSRTRAPVSAAVPSYTYNDDTVSGGHALLLLVKSTDGVSCISSASNEVDALATGQCLLAPSFAGVDGGHQPRQRHLHAEPELERRARPTARPRSTYNVYRSTTSGFTPAPANRIATGVTAESYARRGRDRPAARVLLRRPRGGRHRTGSRTTNVVAEDRRADRAYHDDELDATPSKAPSRAADSTGPAGPGPRSRARRTGPGPPRRTHDGTHSWFAADVGSVSDKVLVSPPFGVGPATTLSFWHTYAFEGTTSTLLRRRDARVHDERRARRGPSSRRRTSPPAATLARSTPAPRTRIARQSGLVRGDGRRDDPGLGQPGRRTPIS